MIKKVLDEADEAMILLTCAMKVKGYDGSILVSSPTINISFAVQSNPLVLCRANNMAARGFLFLIPSSRNTQAARDGSNRSYPAQIGNDDAVKTSVEPCDPDKVKNSAGNASLCNQRPDARKRAGLMDSVGSHSTKHRQDVDGLKFTRKRGDVINGCPGIANTEYFSNAESLVER